MLFFQSLSAYITMSIVQGSENETVESRQRLCRGDKIQGRWRWKKPVTGMTYTNLWFWRSDFQHVKGRFPAPKVSNFQDTSWVSYNSNQFWHYLPGDNIGEHRLSTQLCKTALLSPTSIVNEMERPSVSLWRQNGAMSEGPLTGGLGRLKWIWNISWNRRDKINWQVIRDKPSSLVTPMLANRTASHERDDGIAIMTVLQIWLIKDITFCLFICTMWL